MKRILMRKLDKNYQGIAGIETVIILIAFVVVAAAFTYTALSAGLFSTQKSQAAVYSGLKETQSTLELKGNVMATANGTGGNAIIQQISFTVSNVLGGEPIDFTEPTANTTGKTGLAADGSNNKVIINYIDQDQTVNDLYWSIDKLGGSDADNLLENNEKFKVTIGGDSDSSGAGNLINALSTDLSTNKEFSLIIQTPVGAILEIERTTPAYIDTIMNLH